MKITPNEKYLVRSQPQNVSKNTCSYQKFTDRLRKENVFSNVWGKYLKFAKELDLFIKFYIVLFSAETSENKNQLKTLKNKLQN